MKDEIDFTAEVRALEFALRDQLQRLDRKVDHSAELALCMSHT